MSGLSVALLCLLSFLTLSSAQSQAACYSPWTPGKCAIFQTILIETQGVVTTIEINVTNTCPNQTYYVEFNLASDSTASATTLSLVSASGTYNGAYTWTYGKVTDKIINSANSNAPTSFLRFTPLAGSSGVNGNNPPVNYAMATIPNPSLGPNYEVFNFEVTGFVPQYPFYWIAHIGTNYDIYGPLDMSNCYCTNCDFGYNSRLIQTCNLNYTNSGGTYTDYSTNLTQSIFNENGCLWGFQLTNNRIQAFYTDEHALLLGISSAALPSGVTMTYTGLPATPPAPMCISNLVFPNTIWDGHNPQANIDGNGAVSGCTDGGVLTCGRPLPPALFITDLTQYGANSKQGDWQYGGPAFMPTGICGTWKTAAKTTIVLQPSTNTYSFDLVVQSDPAQNVNGKVWNLGAGADPVPIWDANGNVLITPQGYGAEAMWDLAQLPLIQSHSYRLQFTVHDGDQTRVGGDVGQACIQLTAQCDPGFTGPTCTQCDTNPLPSNGLYTWFCIPVGSAGSTNPYLLRKIPKTEINNPAYAGGFIPSASYFDPLGYAITCDCQRVIVPCSNNCCGNGQCFNQNGTCTGCAAGYTGADCCTPITQGPPPSNFTNNTNVTIPPPPPPPCYNNGSYCNLGRCVNGTCNCTDIPPQPGGETFTGAACNISHVPPPPPPPSCDNFKAYNCDNCTTLGNLFGLTCQWCPNSLAAAEFLTNGSCLNANETCQTASQYTCVPPTPFVVPPCPDDCSGQGVCTNVTVAANSTNSTANYTQVCICNPGYSGVNCGIGVFTQLTGIIAGTVSTAAVVGICCAAAICVGAGAGGAAAYANRGGGDGLANINNNPLFQGNAHGGVNPLHQH